MLSNRASLGYLGLAVSVIIMTASSGTFKIVVDPEQPQQGQTVNLHPRGITERVRYVEWFRGYNTFATNQIIRYNSDGTRNTGNKFFPEANITSNGTLVIEKFQEAFVGNYTVNVQGIDHLYQATIYLELVSVIMVTSSGAFKIVADPEKPRQNQTVNLHPRGITERVRYVEWFRGYNTSATNQIIRYNSDGTRNTGNKFFPEATITSNGTLVIEKFQEAFVGNYTVSVQGIDNLYQATIYLELEQVQVPSLSPGAIAGIVIGVLAAVVATIIGGVYVYNAKFKDSGPL